MVAAVLVPLLIVAATVAATELLAVLIHRHVMHGFGWGWHRSHHEAHDDLLEENDLYAVVFAVLAMALMAAGHWVAPLFWIAIGLAVYGVLYFMVHDGLVHQRWPFRHVPRRGYLKRLYQAHKMHHAVEGRDGTVSFGFLYAPPLERLREDLRRNGGLAPRAGAERPGRTG